MNVKPTVVIDFAGPEGNTLVILGRCARAARKAGWPDDTIDSFKNEMLSHDRSHAIDMLFECFDVQVPVVSSFEADRTMVR